MLVKFAKDRPDDYKTFWSEFGPVLKEGAAQDFANKEQLLQLVRFEDQHNTQISLTDYVGDMKSGQEKIYYLIADNASLHHILLVLIGCICVG